MIKKILKEKMNEGFSLVELVMVMVILGILSAVAVPKMTSVLNSAAVSAEKTTVDTIWAGCETYASDKLIETGNESWPYNPLTVMGRTCLLYTSPSPRDGLLSRMPSSA